ALLRGLEVFRALPVPSLEGVAHTARTVTAAAGTTIVREGDDAAAYYAIADGTCDVTRGYELVRSLERGEGFGEIALLHDTVRTATVRARTDGRLVTVDREAFLVAVTGHPGTRRRVEQVATQHLVGDATPASSSRD